MDGFENFLKELKIMTKLVENQWQLITLEGDGLKLLVKLVSKLNRVKTYLGR